MEPLYDVTEVHVLPGHKLSVLFADGLKGTVELSERLEGPIFGPLRDETLFSQAYIEHGAVVWPNGADLAPDAMYDEIKKSGCWVVRLCKGDFKNEFRSWLDHFVCNNRFWWCRASCRCNLASQ